MGLLYGLPALAGAVGWGDVKLGMVTGMVLAPHGWSAVPTGTVCAVLFSGTIAGVLLAVRRARTSTQMAYAPGIITGALTALAVTAT